MSQVKLSIPQTLLYQLQSTAKQEGVSLEEYILFILSRQTILSSIAYKVSEEDAEYQYQNFNERISQFGKISTEEFEKVLLEREPVDPEPDLQPETVSRLKNRIDEARKKAF